MNRGDSTRDPKRFAPGHEGSREADASPGPVSHEWHPSRAERATAQRPAADPLSSVARVLIVGDAGVCRSGLRLLLERQPRLDVIGEVAACRDALALLSTGVVVVLVDMDSRAGVEPEGLEELARHCNGRVLMMASEANRLARLRAVQLGAMGLVLKEKHPDALVVAVERVHGGDTYFDRTMLASAFRLATGGDETETVPDALGVSALTRREREVVTLAARGLRNRQIGEALFISEVTVRHHLTSIFGKLGLADRLELMKFALRHGLAPLPE